VSDRIDLMTIRQLRAEVESLRDWSARGGLSLHDEARLTALVRELRERAGGSQ
jgi:hypothetical protein